MTENTEEVDKTFFMYKIYKLIDPITSEIKYIGRTKQTLTKRLKRHIKDCDIKSNHKTNWIKSLKNKNLIPIIEIIKDKILTIDEANTLEMMYIKEAKIQGYNLTNLTEGGGGAIGYKHTPETINKLKKYSHPHSKETKELLSTIVSERYKKNFKFSSFEQEILKFIKNNPNYSQRKIAKQFQTNAMKITRIIRKDLKYNI